MIVVKREPYDAARPYTTRPDRLGAPAASDPENVWGESTGRCAWAMIRPRIKTNIQFKDNEQVQRRRHLCAYLRRQQPRPASEPLLADKGAARRAGISLSMKHESWFDKPGRGRLAEGN